MKHAGKLIFLIDINGEVIITFRISFSLSELIDIYELVALIVMSFELLH